jgi:hypothetical protein
MKTIVRKETGLSTFLFNDNVNINVFADKVEIGDPVQFTIADCNLENCIVYENVSQPVDYVGGKYFYSDNTWSTNPDFVDPRIGRDQA